MDSIDTSSVERQNIAAINPTLDDDLSATWATSTENFESPGMYDPGFSGAAQPFAISLSGSDISVAGGYLFSSSLDTSPLWVSAVTELSGPYVWLKMTSANGYEIQSAVIEAGTAWPTTLVGTTLPYVLYIPLGQVVNDEVQQFRRDHLFLAAAHGTPGTILIPR